MGLGGGADCHGAIFPGGGGGIGVLICCCQGGIPKKQLDFLLEFSLISNLPSPVSKSDFISYVFLYHTHNFELN